jgi:predicted RecB family nuclease
VRLVDGDLSYSASDFSNFLACRHLTRLELAAAHGKKERPLVKDVGFEALVRRGEEHEARVLKEFRERGWAITTITNPFSDFEAAAAETVVALARRADVIYQAALQSEDRLGYPDFLVRADLLAGGGGYEVVDAKLARSAKARAVLQTTYYSRLLAEATGNQPEHLHLALGHGEFATLRVSDFAAYERQIDAMIHEFAVGEPVFPVDDPYPDPVEHCAICRWRTLCRERRRTDDDLSLIAGITARQRKVLKADGIQTRRSLAALAGPPRLEGVTREGMARIHAQASIQVAGEDAGEPRWELVEPEREDGELVSSRGLLALPMPSEGDLFFDIEGARYYSEDGKEFGLQYLFGIVDTSEPGSPYRSWWAFDRADEKRAFEELMDFLAGYIERHPDAHVYHYNHYEPTTVEHLSEMHMAREDVLRHLMGRFGTREEEVDHLLRRQIFVDLYRVVRQGIRASVESYSIKRLEPFCGYERTVELEELNSRIVDFEMAMDEGTAQADTETRAIVQGYNEDDCRATLALRDWLEERRKDLAEQLGHAVPRPTSPEEREDRTPPEIKELRERLTHGLPDDESDWTDEQRARALLSELLLFHRREAKPRWWRYFYLKQLNDEELLEERDSIAGLQHVRELGPEKRSVLSLYSFPEQEHSFDKGDAVEDPILGTEFSVWEVDEVGGTLTLKRGPAAQGNPHPSALIEPSKPFYTDAQQESLQWLARTVLDARDPEWPRSPAFDLLLRRPPGVGGGSGPLVAGGDDGLERARDLALALDRSCLPVQGPPGTGKTHTGANQIVALVKNGKKVGVTAMSHAVIAHMLDEVGSIDSSFRDRLGQRAGKEDVLSQYVAASDRHFTDNPKALVALQSGEIAVLGGTSWLWSRPEFQGEIDVLVVDEAGQISLADVLASSRAAKNLILLGDPLQLAHPTQGSHPPILRASSLEHILGDSATMPPDLGLFIPKTRRMHPAITAFTSEVFYDGRLAGIEGLEQQEVLCGEPLAGAGLRVAEVEHQGNANSSPEEAAKVAEIVSELVGCRWRDMEQAEREIGMDDVLVVTPFNAQLREIARALGRAGHPGVKVGTVDMFQGREAPVVIYSTASSSAEEAPRGMEFLYNLNRLNVATSRARCMAILVASPDLVRVFARTPQQMALANALCRLWDLALRTRGGIRGG